MSGIPRPNVWTVTRPGKDGWGDEVAAQRHRAVRVIAGNALDAADLRDLLGMLELNPAEGNRLPGPGPGGDPGAGKGWPPLDGAAWGERESGVVPAILHVVAGHYLVSIGAILGVVKTRDLVWPRHVAMYLCRDLAGLSFPDIGKVFRRDHSTVMFADRKVRGEVARSQQVGGEVAGLADRINARLALDAE